MQSILRNIFCSRQYCVIWWTIRYPLLSCSSLEMYRRPSSFQQHLIRHIADSNAQSLKSLRKAFVIWAIHFKEHGKLAILAFIFLKPVRNMLNRDRSIFHVLALRDNLCIPTALGGTILVTPSRGRNVILSKNRWLRMLIHIGLMHGCKFTNSGTNIELCISFSFLSLYHLDSPIIL